MSDMAGQPTGAGAEPGSDTGIGALLRVSRLRVGEELRDVAMMLRIRNSYLEAIEAGRFNELPGQAYAVGFVRAYADHLGLDSEEVVRRFKKEAAGDTSTDLRFPTPVIEANVPGGAIVFIGLLIAILAYGVWYVSTSDENYLAELIEPLPARLAALVSRD
ncbi:MAG: helix-turn-helix domain-containing protein, partial [Rhodospirillaceae bacterium]